MELDGITVEIPEVAPVEAESPAEPTPQAEPVVDWQKKAQTLQEIANRKDKQLARERAEKEELRRFKELYELHTNAPKAPKEESYTDVADLIAAKLEYSQQQKIYDDKLKALQQPPQQAPQAEKQYAPEFLQAVHATSEKIAKAKAANPEFRTLVDSHAQVIDQAPDHVYEAFSALENPEAALYEVLKSGDLENIYYMTPAQAAVRIAMAEQRGKMAMQKPVTKAQPPIAPSKGTSSVRGVESLHGSDLLKWLDS